MAGGFALHLLDEIRARVDIVELVGQWVTLRRAGVNWKGLCPFHAEKTPSFTVHPGKGIFHCFGCGAGGDVFGFLMRQDRLTFPEAVRALAARAGVALPAPSAPAAGDGKIEALRQVMARAAEFYRERLWDAVGARAREYLTTRGIDAEIAKRFGLGWAPEGWDHLLGVLRQHGVPDDLAAQAGLVVPRQTGPGFYDRFRARLLFPIRDPQGRVVAFGGRGLGAEEPKYLNSPETPLYVKGQVLYGLDLARETMRARGRAIVVEGYVDCVMAHQHGFTETVAALGTAFTPAQLALLRRHAEEVVTVFDADAAGQKAAARAEELLDDPGELRDLGWSVARAGGGGRPAYFSVKVAVLPPGHDPDSLLRAEGVEAFRSRLDEARGILSFVMAQALDAEDLRTERGRATAHARAALILSKVTDAEEATSLARQASRALAVDATQLWIEARQLRGARARQVRLDPSPSAMPAPAPAWPAPTLAERDLVTLLVHRTEARAALLPCLEDDDLSHPGLRSIVAALREAGPGVEPAAILPSLAGEAERGLLAGILVADRDWPHLDRQIAEIRRRFDIRQRKRRLREVSQAIARAQGAGEAPPPGLAAELESLQREARAVRDLAVGRPASPSQP